MTNTEILQNIINEIKEMPKITCRFDHKPGEMEIIFPNTVERKVIDIEVGDNEC